MKGISKADAFCCVPMIPYNKTNPYHFRTESLAMEKFANVHQLAWMRFSPQMRHYTIHSFHKIIS